MADELAPCPFCEDGGNPFPYCDKHEALSYTVKCYTCGATGPYVKFQTTPRKTWDEVADPASEEAVRRWNEYLGFHDIIKPFG